jgi:hypothetical protein
MRPVTRMHFEHAIEKMQGAERVRVGTGINFSLLEYSQLKNQISDVLPHDGSAFVLVGKGELGKTKKGNRQLQNFMVARFPEARAPRRKLTAGSKE